MVRTQIQLPDELYNRAKQLAKDREMTLAEVIRRGLETILDQYPIKVERPWELPILKGLVLKVPLEDLHEIAFQDMEAGLLGKDEDQ